MIWEIQTQRFSLPSSLGPELSRFWGNRTSVSHPHCLSAKPISFFCLFLPFSLFLPGSLCCHRLSVLQWDAGNQSLVFSVLWPRRMWQTIVKSKRASRGGVVKTIQISFSFTTPHREDTNPACVASFASCFLFPHPESFSRYMLATTHSRTPRSRLLSFNARIRTLKGRMISFGCGHVKFTSFFCVCVTCST